MRIVVNENSQVFSVTYNNGQTKEFPLTKNFQLPQEIDVSENPMITVIYVFTINNFQSNLNFLTSCNVVIKR